MNELVLKIKNVVKELFDVDVTPEVTPAPKNTGADFSSNVAMKLAGMLKQNPRQVAEQLAGKFDDITAGLGTNGDGKLGQHLKDLGITHVQILPMFDYAQKNNITIEGLKAPVEDIEEIVEEA